MHPDAPWLRNPEWARGQIDCDTGSSALAITIFALLWNAIAMPAGYFGGRELLEKREPMLLLVLLFPAIGLLLLYGAAHAILRRRRFGRSTLHLTSIPAPVGGRLTGTIQTTMRDRPESVVLTLQCAASELRRTSKGSSWQEHPLWDASTTVSGAALLHLASGVGIPVSIDIPADIESTDEDHPERKIAWKLTARATLSGVDYEASFAVPVFATGRSASQREERSALGSPSTAMGTEAPRRPSTAPPAAIESRTTATGGLDLRMPSRLDSLGFSAAVAVGGAIFVAAFLAIFVAVFGAPILAVVIAFGVELAGIQHAPSGLLIYALAFAITAIPVFVLGSAAWSGRVRVAVKDGVIRTGLEVRGHPLYFRKIPCAAVSNVEVRPRALNGRAHFEVIVRQENDAASLPAIFLERAEADWVAATLAAHCREGG